MEQSTEPDGPTIDKLPSNTETAPPEISTGPDGPTGENAPKASPSEAADLNLKAPPTEAPDPTAAPPLPISRKNSRLQQVRQGSVHPEVIQFNFHSSCQDLRVIH